MVRRLRARSFAGAAEVEAGLDAVRFEPRAAAGDAGDFGDGEFGEQFGLVVGVLDRDGLVGLGGVGEELGERASGRRPRSWERRKCLMCSRTSSAVER